MYVHQATGRQTHLKQVMNRRKLTSAVLMESGTLKAQNDRCSTTCWRESAVFIHSISKFAAASWRNTWLALNQPQFAAVKFSSACPTHPTESLNVPHIQPLILVYNFTLFDSCVKPKHACGWCACLFPAWWTWIDHSLGFEPLLALATCICVKAYGFCFKKKNKNTEFTLMS